VYRHCMYAHNPALGRWRIASLKPACPIYQDPVPITSPCPKKRSNRYHKLARHWQFTPVIIATLEAETRRISVQGQPGQILQDSIFEQPEQNGLEVCWLKGRVPALQVQSPELKPQSHPPPKKKVPQITIPPFLSGTCHLPDFPADLRLLHPLELGLPSPLAESCFPGNSHD
jgi:hypothetical protein